MVREFITSNDFQRVAKENEFFLWHFLQKKQHENLLVLSPILVQGREDNELKIILDLVDIPYFESYTEDNIDFLNNLGYPYKNLWRPSPPNNLPTTKEFFFSPIIIGFKKHKNVLSTFETCYCPDGLIRIIDNLDPKFTEQMMKNL